ncbi:MAG: hypothetical protein RL220_252, partial [Bacteroidota bacterium]
HYAEGSIAVRLFHFGDAEFNTAYWTQRIRNAYDLREKLGLVSNSSTTMYRLVHAEGDGLPGLIIDIYDSVAVIQTHSTGMHELRHEFVHALRECYGDRLKAVYDKSELKMKKNTGVSTGDGYLFGGMPAQNDFREHDCLYSIDWVQGQKTGFFLDQRENRKLLGEMSRGARVLNMFCYTGGFSVSALKGGATLVHSVDSSQQAIELTDEHVKMNGFGQDRHQSFKSDSLDFMRNANAEYDIVVLDPPAYAKHLSARHKAVQGYRRLNETAFRMMKPGGIVFTFSCSQAVDKALFSSTIYAAALDAGRNIRVLYQMHQPADHPFSMFHPEGEYLKGLVLQVI